MKFSDFIKSGEVRKAKKDTNLAKSLLKTAKSDLIYFNNSKLDENSARKIVSNYYDILRSILDAITALGGWKIYSHETFTYYLKEKKEDLLSIKFDRFRKIRNKINYYGKEIEVDEAKNLSEEIKKLVSTLINKYLSGLED